MSLKLTNIVKSFKEDLVLDGVSLEVGKGETVVLFGPSGAGKTVLLRLIAGVIEPDSGKIEIDGNDLEGVEPEDRGIGMAFQNFALFPHMDAHANIASPLTATTMGKGDIANRVQEVASLLKIDHVLHHKPRALSNGQKQRTALGRALAGKPSVLLLDDPLRNVDAKLRFEMRLELPRLIKSQNATVIYVTQDYKEAMALGDRIAVMSKHGIAQIGTLEDIYLSPANTEIARLFGDPVINLLDVVPDANNKIVRVNVSETSIPLDAGYAALAGQACVMGIRPEAITFVTENAKGAFPIEIEAETPLNEKTVTLAATQNKREILISRPAGTPAPSSGKAHIAIDAGRVMLFDKLSGERITPESARQGEAA